MINGEAQDARAGCECSALDASVNAMALMIFYESRTSLLPDGPQRELAR
jgi:hypothetical protein